jgi:hypothetical protein
MEQLLSHIWLSASSYMGKYLRISSYIRKLFLIYYFATAPLLISLYMRKIWFSFLSVQSINSDKHLPQSPFTGQCFLMTTFPLGVYIVNKSMVELVRCIHKFMNNENGIQMSTIIWQFPFLSSISFFQTNYIPYATGPSEQFLPFVQKKLLQKCVCSL